MNLWITTTYNHCYLGDTALNLAEASDGGTVVAFEMGPPVHMLKINKKYSY